MMRVLLYELPQLLTGIVMDTLQTQLDIEVSTSAGGCVGLIPAATKFVPDVIIRYSDSWTPSRQEDELLKKMAWLRFLVLSNRGNKTWLYENKPAKTDIGEISPKILLATIRGECNPQDRSA